MSVVFKYKTNCSQEYAPGYVSTGIDGEIGSQGDHGSALYFVDYDLNNSYDIELALQKIENNYVLSSKTITQLSNRGYQVNDLLLSTNGTCYRLVKSSENSLFKNYTFDIEELGKLKKSSPNDAMSVVMMDFTGAEIYNKNTGALLASYPSETKTCAPTPRSRASNGYVANQEPGEAFSLYGAWIKMCILTKYDKRTQYDPDHKTLTGARYGLRIDLVNDKKFLFNGVPSEITQAGSPNGPTLDGKQLGAKYMCPLEFPALSTLNRKEDEFDFGDVFTEYESVDDVSNPSNMDTVYLSDYSMDLVHPSGNDIICTRGGLGNEMDSGAEVFYKSGYAAGNNRNIPTALSMGYKSMNAPLYGDSSDPATLGYNYAADKEETKMGNEIRKYTGGHIFSASTNGNDLTDYNIPKYGIGGSLSTISVPSLQNEMYDSSTFFIKSKRKLGTNLVENDCAGESLYFSGMPSEHVGSEIFKFVSAKTNNYYVVSRNTATKELTMISIMALPITTFRNKKVMLSFETTTEDGHTFTKISKIELTDK